MFHLCAYGEYCGNVRVKTGSLLETQYQYLAQLYICTQVLMMSCCMELVTNVHL